MQKNAKSLLEDIKQFFSAESSVKLEEAILDNGTKIEADSFESGKEVFIVGEDEKVALPIGEYTLEDGRVLIVSEEGIIDAIKDAEAVVEETPEEAPAEEEMSEDVKFISVEDFNSVISELRAEIQSLKAPQEELEEAPEVRSELPKTRTVKEEFSEVEVNEVEEIVHSPEA